MTGITTKFHADSFDDVVAHMVEMASVARADADEYKAALERHAAGFNRSSAAKAEARAEALKEIADISKENDRFLTKPAETWQPGILNP